MQNIDEIIGNAPSPIYICYEELLEKNLILLSQVSKRADIKILLALKGFAYFPLFNLIKKYLHGACASGLNETTLAYENIGLEVHTYSPAYKKEDIEKIAKMSEHLVFNSQNQLYAYKDIAKNINQNISLALRINPEISFSPTTGYDPCATYSRFGVTKKDFDEKCLDFIDGLHFHVLCEQNSQALEYALEHTEKSFGKYFDRIKWLNLGGGHHITKRTYDVEHLVHIINKFHKKYPHLSLYLEPGEAVGWQCGVLVSEVLDIVYNDMNIAILDTSAEAHMPDVLAMPYRPDVRYASVANDKKYTYRLGGNTCLSGDIIGDYSFDNPLGIGDKIIFEDMMHYANVKNTTFNGIKLPSIGYVDKNNKLHITKTFGYEDYKYRLG